MTVDVSRHTHAVNYEAARDLGILAPKRRF
jgi:hypothetical protein